MRTPRSISLLLAGAMATTAPLGACSRDTSRNQPPPAVDDTRAGNDRDTRQAPTPDRPRLSTGKKVVILAGAAALYYLYKHHKNATAKEGIDGQYYLSKNGRVYYRDAEHRAHWVTPPPQGIEVSEAEGAEYEQLKGYNGRTTGRDLSDIAQPDNT